MINAGMHGLSRILPLPLACEVLNQVTCTNPMAQAHAYTGLLRLRQRMLIAEDVARRTKAWPKAVPYFLAGLQPLHAPPASHVALASKNEYIIVPAVTHLQS